MLKPEMQQKVLLSSAPLAEGGISAAFKALSGASISDVAKGYERKSLAEAGSTPGQRSR
jgi:dihydroxyacetone kinase DhaKLM complex PTS-EIIA-like component DhaM